MDMGKILGIGIVAAILALTVKQEKPELGIMISIVAGIMIFLMISEKLPDIVNALNGIVVKAEMDTIYLVTLIKIVGVAYMTEFGSQICKDMSENSIAAKIELGGKVIIMMMGLPILMSLMDMIMGILQ